MTVRRWRRLVLVTAGVVALTPLPACDEEINMATQPHYIPLQATDFFDGGASARPIVEGTVARTGALFTSAPPVRPIPQAPLSMALLQRGQERFNIYCAPCHGRDGYGRGMVVERGYPAPPSYQEARLLSVTDEHIYMVIANGLGKMPPYGKNVPPRDRWAIVAYVRALQLSQHARWGDVPEAERSLLEPPPTTARSVP
jgi:mono/diheme cytochrome c family protein